MLYGFLGDKYGRVHHYEVSNVAEAVRAMCATLDGFRQAIVDGGYYKVLLGGKDRQGEDNLNYPSSEKESIRIIPVIAGSGGVGKIILGAALIVASIYVPALGATIGSTGVTFASVVGKIGFSLILGGVSQLLFKPPQPPKSTERPENRPSFIFNGAVNTSRQGGAVPIAFGEIITGSQVIGAGLDAQDIPA